LGCKPTAGIIIESTQQSGTLPNSRQMFHRDFNPRVVKSHRAAQVYVNSQATVPHPPTFPWTILLMLSGPGFLYVSLSSGRLVKICVPQGCAVVFRGDVLHAGAAYQHWHVRAHWYVTPVTSPFYGITSPDDWRLNQEGMVALFDEDPTREWDPDTARVEPAGVVILAHPYVHSIAELVESPYLKY